jgi:exosome complex exonuclease DIS3/RRP44
LVLASPEVRFQVDSETHEPVEVQVKKLLETNSMVEEWMLKANMTVAERIFEVFPECACLRRHPAPPLPSFDPVVRATAPRGFQIDVTTNKNLAASLEKAVVAENPFYNTMLRILTTRCVINHIRIQ